MELDGMWKGRGKGMKHRFWWWFAAIANREEGSFC